MPAMTAEEAAKAAALEKLAAAAAAVETAEDALGALQRDASGAWDAWTRDPGPVTKAAREAAQKQVDIAARALDTARIAHYRAIVAAYGARVTFEDGPEEWADLETRPTHDEYVKLLEATARLAEAKLDAKFAVMGDFIAVLLREWKVKGRDGAELPRTVEGIAAAPFDRTRPIFERAMAIFRSLPTPNL